MSIPAPDKDPQVEGVTILGKRHQTGLFFGEGDATGGGFLLVLKRKKREENVKLMLLERRK